MLKLLIMHINGEHANVNLWLVWGVNLTPAVESRRARSGTHQQLVIIRCFRDNFLM